MLYGECILNKEGYFFYFEDLINGLIIKDYNNLLNNFQCNRNLSSIHSTHVNGRNLDGIKRKHKFDVFYKKF